MKPFNLEEYLANPTKRLITRDGRKVTIYCTNYNSNFPIIAEIEGTHSSDSFNEEGKFSQISDSENDLFFAPEKHEGWVNIFKCASNANRYVEYARIFQSKEDAEEAIEGDSDYITTLKIEWEE